MHFPLFHNKKIIFTQTTYKYACNLSCWIDSASNSLKDIDGNTWVMLEEKWGTNNRAKIYSSYNLEQREYEKT